jgi:uncharacterized ubiquitin-like protein YukD
MNWKDRECLLLEKINILTEMLRLINCDIANGKIIVNE